METLIPVPAGFDLRAVVGSHGWYQLRPFAFDAERGALSGVFRNDGRTPVAWTVTEGGRGKLRVACAGATDASGRARIGARLARILGLRTDLAPFHAHCRRHPALRWIARRGLGRFLAGEDLWEDMAKTLLTTNCTWKQTIAMVERLSALGRRLDGGARAFPGPEAVAAAGMAHLEREVRVGYRARGLIELARSAVAGGLDGLETLPTDDLYAGLRGFHGFGDYAASSLLLLLGRADRLIADSWAMARARARHFAGRKGTPARLRRIYEPHTPFQALVAWFDLNRDEFRRLPPEWV